MGLDYLLKQEWSMGCGQCPECCGKPEDWFGNIHCLTADTIGHKKDCGQSAAIKELGGSPLMIGDYKSDKVFESYWTENGFLGIREVEIK